MKMIFFWIACTALFVVPVYFVKNSVYQDGIAGRFGLLLISFFAAMFMLDAGTSEGPYDINAKGVGMLTAFAIFIVWHLWRFHTRVARKRTSTPAETEERRHQPDRRFA